GGVLKILQESGQGDAARSWVGSGPNKTISQGDLANALGGDTLDELSEQTGMNRGDLLSGLSQHLPRFVDQLTPDGRLPTEEEAHRMVWSRPQTRSGIRVSSCERFTSCDRAASAAPGRTRRCRCGAGS